MNEKIDWFANYTDDPSSGRTHSVRRFDRLRDARRFAQGRSGYIVRLSDGGARTGTGLAYARLAEYFGGFEPSAQEGARIRAIEGVDA